MPIQYNAFKEPDQQSENRDPMSMAAIGLRGTEVLIYTDMYIKRSVSSPKPCGVPFKCASDVVGWTVE